jgi:hypothetical protein
MDDGNAHHIPGLPGWWQESTARYAYASDRNRCPVCHHIGWLWCGWFTCDGTCHAVAIISDGRVFVPVKGPREQDQEEAP